MGVVHIVQTPGTCSGAARIDGHRIPCWTLWSLLKQGASIAELGQAYPGITEEQIKAALHYAIEHESEMDERINE